MRSLILASPVLLLALAMSPWVPAQNPPAFPARETVCNVRDYGARGDGATLDTAAIAEAIRNCAARRGGTVLFPPGEYVSGTFELQSNITLELSAGAVLIGSPNLADYGKTADYGFGKDYGNDSSGEGDLTGIIVARGAQNIAIVGRGAIDGRGDAFMDLQSPHLAPDFDAQYTRNPEQFARAVQDTSYGPVEPKQHGAGRPGTMIILSHCRNVLIRDVTLRAAPNWTLHLQNTEQAVITGIHIQNNPLIPNNDGIDCMRCKHVHVSDSDIQAGDDDFAIVGSEDVNVSNCSLVSRSSAIRLEGTRHSTFQNLTIESNRGIGIFHRGDSDEITEAVLFSGITMRTRLIPGHWWGKAEPIYVAVRPCERGACRGGIRDVTLSNITAEAESGILVYGTPENPVIGLTLDRVRLVIRAPQPAISEAVGGNFDLRWTARRLEEAIFRHDIPGVYSRWVKGMRIQGLQIQWSDRLPPYFTDGVRVEDFQDLFIANFDGRQAQSHAGAAISLTNGSDVSITGSRAAPGTQTFLHLAGVTGRRSFLNNDMSAAAKAIIPAGVTINVSSSGRKKKGGASPRP
jgi:hypothetical protein